MHGTQRISGAYIIPHFVNHCLGTVESRRQEKALSILALLHPKGADDSGTRSVRIWDFKTGELLFSFNSNAKAEYQLADEVALHIFKFLPPANLLKMGFVCRQWHRLSKDEMLWKELYSAHGIEKKEETQTWYGLGCALLHPLYNGEILKRKPAIRYADFIEEKKEPEKFRIERSGCGVRIFDQQTGQRILSLYTSSSQLFDVRIIGSHVLTSGGKNGVLEVWDFKTGQRVVKCINTSFAAKPQIHNNILVFLEVHRDEKFFSSTLKYAVSVCYLDKSKKDFSFEVEGNVTAMSLQGNTLALCFSPHGFVHERAFQLVDIEKQQIVTASSQVSHPVLKMEWDGLMLKLTTGFNNREKYLENWDFSKQASQENPVKPKPLLLKDRGVSRRDEEKPYYPAGWQ